MDDKRVNTHDGTKECKITSKTTERVNEEVSPSIITSESVSMRILSTEKLTSIRGRLLDSAPTTPPERPGRAVPRRTGAPPPVLTPDESATIHKRTGEGGRSRPISIQAKRTDDRPSRRRRTPPGPVAHTQRRRESLYTGWGGATNDSLTETPEF